jgi:Transcriptional regulator
MSDKQIKRDEIAKAAKELFTHFGYKAVSMDSIADRANVAKGTIYLYFKDKEALFKYLLNEFIDEFDIIIKQIKNKNLPLVEEVKEVVYTLLRYRKNQEFIFKVISEAREMNITIAKNGVTMIDNQIASYLKSRLQSIVTDKINLEVIAFVIIKSYSALAFEWEQTHDPLDEKAIAQSIGLIFGDLLTAAEKKNGRNA